MLVFYLLVFEKKRDGWHRGYAGPRCPARQSEVEQEQAQAVVPSPAGGRPWGCPGGA